MFEENFRILENDGATGTVETLDRQFVTSKYYWVYLDERAELISEQI